MPAGDRERAILERLQQVCRYAYEHAPFYRRKWDAAGFHPSQLKSLEDFESRVPVVTKKDLRESQAANPPFGDYLCIPESEVFHVHGTSGTTGRPTAFAVGRNDWRTIANAHARIMWAMGMRPGDLICVAAVFSLYMGSWGALAGAERLGAKAFPFGAGAPGMSARLRAVAPHDEADGLLRHAELRDPPDRGRARGEARPARLRAQVPVLLGRAGRLGAGRQGPHRGRLRRARLRLRLDGRDEPVDERRGQPRVAPGHAVLAGRRLHRGVRPGDHAARAVRRSAARRSTRTSSAPASR